MFYTLLLDRETPDNIREMIIVLIRKLERHGYTGRSCNLNSAEKLLPETVEKYELFLYKKNNKYSISDKSTTHTNIRNGALCIAGTHIPIFKNVDMKVKTIYGRRVHSILGYSLDKPSDMIFYYLNRQNRRNLTGLIKKLSLKHNITL